MRKKFRHRKDSTYTSKEQKIAERALAKIADKEGVSVEHVRKHIQVAMLSGMVSPDPAVKAWWQSVPCAGEVPTPEEVIVACAGKINGKF